MYKKSYKEILKQIKKYNTIVIARHVGADPDALASQIALKDIIVNNFPLKKVYVVGMPASRFKYLGTLDKLTDEMYENASMHNEKGAWQMIFGVNTIPSYRQHGYAGELIRRAIFDAKAQHRKGLVLTCKDKLIHYYASFGFVDEGISESVHGNVVWHQMRLTF